jgi:hypothetical protein
MRREVLLNRGAPCLLFYVAASRGREGIAVVTSDLERLGESLGVSMARPSAIELANEITRAKVLPEQDLGPVLSRTSNCQSSLRRSV